MIGMVLVTHGQLATEFRAALEHVVGPQEQLETITIGPEDDMETRRKDIMDAVCRVNSGPASWSSPTCSAARPRTWRSPA
jgi:PTS system mannose-specific IIA component